MSCAVVSCKNRSSQGISLFRFPAQLERRKMWINNIKRGQWKPTESSRLCEVHFEENQFEKNRIDGRIKLKRDAVPTIFNVPNPSKSTEETRKSKHKKILDLPLNAKPNEIENPTDENMQSLQYVNSLKMENEVLRKENNRLKRANFQFVKHVKYLEKTNANFKKQLKDQSKLLEKFLNKDKIMASSTDKMHECSHKAH